MKVLDYTTLWKGIAIFLVIQILYFLGTSLGLYEFNKIVFMILLIIPLFILLLLNQGIFLKDMQKLHTESVDERKERTLHNMQSPFVYILMAVLWPALLFEKTSFPLSVKYTLSAIIIILVLYFYITKDKYMKKVKKQNISEATHKASQKGSIVGIICIAISAVLLGQNVISTTHFYIFSLASVGIGYIIYSNSK
ncbi:MAG: glucan phosphoethanolaminetransferase (alkaline phosphatase superfamily) [Patescibacteria group bacterium]|jgi:glucan phosphoethanolaminetransferase (alkaline phosphatase superfamily)